MKLSEILRMTSLILTASLLVAGCVTAPPATPEQTQGLTIDERLESMTLEEKVGQLFMPGFDAEFLNDSSATFRQVSRWINEYKIGGLAMFGGDPYAASRNILRFQRLSERPLLIASDFEWGVTMRISSGTRFPENMGMGATRNPSLAYEQGVITAREARALGVHMTFSPVLDVNNNPDNPIINVRSYGEDPALVSAFGSSYIDGIQSLGIAATAKHFPGHGDTDTDSHIGLPVINVDQQRLRNVELVPFQSAVDAGVQAIMIAHIALPELPSGDTPATLSPYIIQDVLRDSMGYDGLIISDAMNMGGIVRGYSAGEAAIKAIQAGIDILLLSPEFEAAYTEVLDAVQQGIISEDRINESVRRVLRIKEFTQAEEYRYPDPETLENVLEKPEHLEIAEQAFRESITLVKDDQNIIPIDPSTVSSFATIVITDNINYGYPGDVFVSEMSRRFDNNRVIRIGPDASEAILEQASQAIDNADAAAVGVFVRFASYRGSLNLQGDQAAFLNRILGKEKPIVTIGFGTPYLLRNFPNASTFLVPYSTSYGSQRAIVRAIAGEEPINGKLPITLPAGFEYGHGLTRVEYSNAWIDAPQPARFDSVFKIVRQGVEDSVSPGMAVYVAKDGKILAAQGFGRFTYNRNSPRVGRRTIFDMASITKVMATTPLVMQLYEEGKIQLDRRVSSYIPEFSGGAKDFVTIRHLLTHTSGLPAYMQFWELTGAEKNIFEKFISLFQFRDVADYPAEVLDIIKHTELDTFPGTSYEYSDLGIILLGHILEKIEGKPLDQLVQERLFVPLGMTHTEYIPSKTLWDAIAPTEFDRNFRHRQIQGEVHDENTAVLGGVAGHAGLFSTIDDMGRYAQTLLSNGYYDGTKLYKSSTIDTFTTRQNIVEGSTRALGWDTPSDSGSLFGDYFSSQSFCHTGYTGTSMIIDPEYNVIVILLTNRVYPTRNNWKISEFRPKFHNAVMEALIPKEQLELDRLLRHLPERHIIAQK